MLVALVVVSSGDGSTDDKVCQNDGSAVRTLLLPLFHFFFTHFDDSDAGVAVAVGGNPIREG